MRTSGHTVTSAGTQATYIAYTYVLAEHVEALPQYHAFSRLILHKAHRAIKGLGVDNDVFEVCGLECQEVLLPLLCALSPLRLNVLYTRTRRALSHSTAHTCRNAPSALSNNTQYKNEKIRAKPLECTHSVWNSLQQ